MNTKPHSTISIGIVLACLIVMIVSEAASRVSLLDDRSQPRVAVLADSGLVADWSSSMGKQAIGGGFGGEVVWSVIRP